MECQIRHKNFGSDALSELLMSSYFLCCSEFLFLSGKFHVNLVGGSGVKTYFREAFRTLSVKQVLAAF